MKLLASLGLVLAFASATHAAGLADVVIAVDGSGSMTDEATTLESQLAGFAATISGSGVDLHVIVISRTGASAAGICATAPLGSGACPADENLPGYRHIINSTIGTGNVLSRILSTHPSWSGSLRTGASRTLIAVTDDEDNLSAASFATQLLALDPTFAGYRFDAIVATSCPLSFPFLPTGTQYIDLATTSGGVVSDLCSPDIPTALVAIASQVISDSDDCAPGCPSASLGDATCDTACNVAACGFDSGDCDCAPGCPPASVGDAICDSACNVNACSYDAGDCAFAGVPVDVIVALDTSGSMDAHVAAIETELPGFAAAITTGGADLHLVLLADPSVCASAPLGSGTCPGDENLPSYRHPAIAIASNDALQKIVSSYSSWSGSLRPGAQCTIIVVSDDESLTSASSFQTELQGLDPQLLGCRFHALVRSTCAPIGGVYLQLVQSMGGVVEDLCTEDAGVALSHLVPEILADTAVEVPTASQLGVAVLGSTLVAVGALAMRRARRRWR